MKNYSDWLTKEQAAEALHVSTKTIEKFAADGDLHSAMVKSPETGATRVKYHPRDVAKLREKRIPGAAPFVLPKDGDAGELPARRAAGRELIPLQLMPSETIGQAIGKTLAEGMAQAAAQIFERQAGAVPIERRLFLTRTEAAEYSGLPRSEINRQIKAGELPALRTGRGWRIRRTDLETQCGAMNLNPLRDAYKIPRVSQAEIDARDPSSRITAAPPAAADHAPDIVLQNPLDRFLQEDTTARHHEPND